MLRSFVGKILDLAPYLNCFGVDCEEAQCQLIPSPRLESGLLLKDAEKSGAISSDCSLRLRRGRLELAAAGKAGGRGDEEAR